MAAIVVLDSGPVGVLSNPSRTAAVESGWAWAEDAVRSRVRIVIPEIADYEVRRQLLRAGRATGVTRLDVLLRTFDYEPLTTAVMRRAAGLWADARNRGWPTAHPAALDGDVILAAQALGLGRSDDVAVVTTNAQHLQRYVAVQTWDGLVHP